MPYLFLLLWTLLVSLCPAYVAETLALSCLLTSFGMLLLFITIAVMLLEPSFCDYS